MSEWQPIDTAPKDGTVVDVWSDGQRYADARFDVPGDPDCEPDGSVAPTWVHLDWHTTYDVWEYFEIVPQPTHWMPLPEPPK